MRYILVVVIGMWATNVWADVYIDPSAPTTKQADISSGPGKANMSSGPPPNSAPTAGFPNSAPTWHTDMTSGPKKKKTFKNTVPAGSGGAPLKGGVSNPTKANGIGGTPDANGVGGSK